MHQTIKMRKGVYNNAKYSIGLDYGTLSARAILVDIDTGETIAQSIYEYFGKGGNDVMRRLNHLRRQ